MGKFSLKFTYMSYKVLASKRSWISFKWVGSGLNNFEVVSSTS